MERIARWLDERRAASGLRQLVALERLPGGRVRLAGDVSGRELLDFSSNDYLALSLHPKVIAGSRAALERYGAGAGAARLMSGDLTLHHQLEDEIARLKNQEAALLFGSGYAANTGVIAALAGRDDAVFSDRLNHASIYDGCLLSGARLHRFRHNDVNHLDDLLARHRGKGLAIVVVESVYSMDGDRAPLTDIADVAARHGALLMVDEAHATGIFGPRGGGVIEEEGLSAKVAIAMGTFGKALGSYGAYVACSRQMADYLVNRARSFIFSTALPPAVVGASLASLAVLREEPGLGTELLARVALFKDTLAAGGLTGLGPSQIIPVHLGESEKALAVASRLRAEGVYATAVRPPTVPRGTARIRLSVTRHLTEADLRETAEKLFSILRPS